MVYYRALKGREMKTLYDYYDANPYKNREVKNKDVEGFLITPDDFLKYLEEIKNAYKG